MGFKNISIKNLNDFFDNSDSKKSDYNIKIDAEAHRMLKILSFKTDVSMKEINELIIKSYFNEKIKNSENNSL